MDSLIGNVELVPIVVLDRVTSSTVALVFRGRDLADMSTFLFLEFHEGSNGESLLLDNLQSKKQGEDRFIGGS
jgi:hypothetical protein